MGNCGSDEAFPESKVFRVSLLNDAEDVIGKGDLTVTADALELQSDGITGVAHWELKFLRRFGYDKTFFSIEAGRRCRDGPGIWAFSTPKAESLFKMVDHYINLSKSDQPPAAKQETEGVKVTKGPNYDGVLIGQPKERNSSRSAYAKLALPEKGGAQTEVLKKKFNKKAKNTSYAELDFDAMGEENH